MSKLADIEIQNAKIETELRNYQKAFRDFEDEVVRWREKIDHTLYGNGQVGLTAKFESLKELPKEVKDLRLQIAAWSGGAVVIVLVVRLIFKI